MTTLPSRRQIIQAAAAAAAASAVPAKAAPPFFKLYMMIPNSQPARMAWGTLAARQMTQLGIEVIASYVPFSTIYPRRNKGDGKTYAEGGWDVYLERYYYSSVKPTPNELFSSRDLPPSGQNYYYLQDPVIDRLLDTYSGTADPTAQLQAIHAFEQRWYETEPLTILFYPQDVIAINPKLTGLNATTYRPAFYPRPENWTIEGAGPNASAVFASWPIPAALLPIYSESYNDTNVCGPVYNQLLEYDSWDRKQLVPALAESITQSADGRHWVITLRGGVTWHSGEPFTAQDVKFTFDTIMDPAYASEQRAVLLAVFGSPEACRVTGPLEVTCDLPAYSMSMREFVLSAVSIMPEHAYGGIKPEQMRSHPANTWRGSYTVQTSAGSYTAHGGIGTGAWIPGGYDPARKAYAFAKNPHYWNKTTGNVATFYVVNIQGTDAVLAALKSGEIDAHDPLYDVGALASTIDPAWGRLLTFDSFKWQHICYNLRHPVIGTGVDTPLGRQDPARAAEAAIHVRKAISYAMPRAEIIKQMAGGYGEPGTVPIPFSAPEYDHAHLPPIPFDMELARQSMAKAGYTY